MLNYSWTHSGLWSIFKCVCHLDIFTPIKLDAAAQTSLTRNRALARFLSVKQGT